MTLESYSIFDWIQNRKWDLWTPISWLYFPNYITEIIFRELENSSAQLSTKSTIIII